MTLLTVHKILIASAIALFVLYAALQLRSYTSGDGGGLLRGIIGAAAAVGFAVYLRWVWVHRPSAGPPR